MTAWRRTVRTASCQSGRGGEGQRGQVQDVLAGGPGMVEGFGHRGPRGGLGSLTRLLLCITNARQEILRAIDGLAGQAVPARPDGGDYDPDLVIWTRPAYLRPGANSVRHPP